MDRLLRGFASFFPISRMHTCYRSDIDNEARVFSDLLVWKWGIYMELEDWRLAHPSVLTVGMGHLYKSDALFYSVLIKLLYLTYNLVSLCHLETSDSSCI